MGSNSGVHSFFVYGTLRSDQIRATCWPRRPIRIVNAFARGRLFDLGPYPAMMTGENVVAGERWDFEVEDIPATLVELDAIEGYRGVGARNLYEREILQVYSNPDLSDPFPMLAFGYLMRADILPINAREIVAGGTSAEAMARVAAWPERGLSPQITSLLPDPFPDDVPPPPMRDH